MSSWIGGDGDRPDDNYKGGWGVGAPGTTVARKLTQIGNPLVQVGRFGLLQLANLTLEPRDRFVALRLGRDFLGRAQGHVAIGAPLVRPFERGQDGDEAVVIDHRKWVELMVVAASTAERESEKSL